jgi:hypothetical protein
MQKSCLKFVSDAEAILLQAERDRRMLTPREVQRFNQCLQLAEFPKLIAAAGRKARRGPRKPSPNSYHAVWVGR